MAKKPTPQAPVAPSLGTDSAPPPLAPPLDTGNGPSPSTPAIKDEGGVDSGGQPMGVDPNMGGSAPVSGSSRADVVPSLEVANQFGGVGGSQLDPLDHDGDGSKGGSVPIGATQSYEQLLVESNQRGDEVRRLTEENEKLMAEVYNLREQLASARDPGVGSSLADTVADKVVQRLGGGNDQNASGAPNRPPQHIDQLRTPGINS